MGHETVHNRHPGDGPSAGSTAGTKRDGYNTVKQIRLSQDLFDRANAVFIKKGLSFSEAVRLFLEQTAERKRLPFRPSSGTGKGISASDAEAEARFVSNMLGLGNGNAEERLLHMIFGEEKAEDLSDEQLEEWAMRTGLPENMDPATLAELYDRGVFEKNPYRGSFEDTACDSCYGENGFSCDNCPKWPMTYAAKKENLRENLKKAFDRLYISSVNTLAGMAYGPDVTGDREEEDLS